jgi:hypothetical protein
LRAGFEGGREPLAIAADGAFAQLGVFIFGDGTFRQRAAIDGRQSSAAGEDQRFAIGMEGR